MNQNLNIVILIAVILTVIYIFYNLYSRYNSSKITLNKYTNLIPNAIDGKITRDISSTSAISSEFSNNYSLSFWLNVAGYKYKYKQDKIIIQKGDSMKIYLEPLVNNLNMKVKLQTNNEPVFTNNIKMTEEEFSNTDEYGNISGNNVNSSSLNYNNEYFNDISGNILTSEGFVDTEEIPILDNYTTKIMTLAQDKETFINQLIIIIENICDIMDILNNKELAKSTIETYDKFFDELIVLINKGVNMINTGVDTNDLYSNLSFMDMNEELYTAIGYLVLISQNPKFNIEELKDEIIEKINETTRELDCDMEFNDDFTLNLFLEKIIRLIQENSKNLIVNMAKEINQNLVEIDTNNIGYDKCAIKDFPLQKWSHIVISVSNNIIDMYLDGNLISSCVLKGFPELNTKDLQLFTDGGFDGEFSNLTHINNSLNQDEVYKLYLQGPTYNNNIINNFSNFIKSLF